jgi:hypothetical protein
VAPCDARNRTGSSGGSDYTPVRVTVTRRHITGPMVDVLVRTRKSPP